MTGYRFDASCPRCGSDLEHVNGVTRAGTESIAVTNCTGCRAGWSIATYMRPLRTPQDERLEQIETRERKRLRALEDEQRQMRRQVNA